MVTQYEKKRQQLRRKKKSETYEKKKIIIIIKGSYDTKKMAEKVHNETQRSVYRNISCF